VTIALHDFTCKVALVTGGASGIGRATARGRADRGATVVISDIAVDEGEAVAAGIRSAGGEAFFDRADVKHACEVDTLKARKLSISGRLDIAHNNRGYRWGQGVDATSEDDWDKTVDLCRKAPWLCIRRELPAMVAQGGGVIVNTASMSGVRYTETANIAYSAAKADVIHMTRHAASAYAKHKITVNAVSLGLVRTQAVEAFLTPMQQTEFAAASKAIGRIIEPDDVADAVIWLCSDASATVMGENICVAGGQQAR
jgi:NAD(P)-dependent dehydrogenase (short-subunit alcohol dehydrogenase family)